MRSESDMVSWVAGARARARPRGRLVRPIGLLGGACGAGVD